MNNFNKIIVTAVSAAIMMGCSNSSSSNGGTTPDYASFAEIETDATALQNTYTDANGNVLVAPTSPAAIPDSGSATYNGFIAGELDGDDLIGQLTLTAEFVGGPGSITSSADGFFHENDGAYTGTLSGTGTFVEDSMSGTIPQVQTSLGGTLQNGGNDYDMNLTLLGFVVPNGLDAIGAVAGTVDGFVTDNSTNPASTVIFDDGVFAAEH